MEVKTNNDQVNLETKKPASTSPKLKIYWICLCST